MPPRVAAAPPNSSDMKVQNGLGGFLGGLLHALARFALHVGNPTFRLVGRKPGAGGDHLRQIRAIIVIEPTLRDAPNQDACHHGAGVGIERGARSGGSNAHRRGSP
jgi:hypothetical protein